MRPYMALGALVPFSALAVSINVQSLNPSLAVRAVNPISLNALCGANSMKNATCLGSTFGDCCSERGYCGSTSIYCDEGCQPGFGTCTSAGTKAKQIVSTSGNCGLVGPSNITCIGASMGSCCSSGGFCGSTSNYCSEGCQAGFGKCDDVDLSVQVMTTSGACGLTETINTTCLGFSKGSCCSSKGWCGADSTYCGTGCQEGFGKCNTLEATTSLKPTQSTSLASPTGSNTSGTSTVASSTSTNTSTIVSSGSSLGSPIPKPGMSTGATAGAAVGSIAGVAIIAAIIFLILRRRRRNKETKSQVAETKYENLNGHYDPKSVQPSPTTINSHMGVSPLTPMQKLETDRLYELGDGQQQSPIELAGARIEPSREDIERERIARMNDRLAAGYDGAYRGN